MTFAELKKTFVLLFRGEWRRVYNEVHVRIYKAFYEVAFRIVLPFRRSGRPLPRDHGVAVQTDHPVAFDSPDHIVPHGTRLNNSANKKFVLAMDQFFAERFPGQPLHFMDLGCAGGQVVEDFRRMRWVAVGLEGSDYSLKHRRANWKHLGGTQLFTCDISRPYTVTRDGAPLKFHLITAWEVMEHIHPDRIRDVFDNVRDHLVEGGCFVASTTGTPDVVGGLELHQTQMTNAQWRQFVERHYPELEPADLGLKIYQYVRYNFLSPSFLIYRRKSGSGASSKPGLGSGATPPEQP